MGSEPTLRVLQALKVVRSTTNPYLVMLRRGQQAAGDVELLDFSYRRALLGRYDLWHLHWPENLLAGGSPVKTAGRQVLLVAVLLRLQLSRTPIVRTLHNIEPPSGLRPHEYRLLSWIERLTRVWIRLNDHTPSPDGRASVLIPHGHYRDWFAELPRRTARPGRFGYVGLIRRYKGVERLLEAFIATRDRPGPAVPDPGGVGHGRPDPATLRLYVGGKPSGDELAAVVRDLAATDERVEVRLDYLSDAELVDAVTASELVVLPYRFMHNSGGTLAALSLDRPVLVPDNEVNRELSAEVGPGWVFTFTDELDATTLLRVLAEVRDSAEQRQVGDGRPDLSGREWAETAQQHRHAYQLALAER